MASGNGSPHAPLVLAALGALTMLMPVMMPLVVVPTVITSMVGTAAQTAANADAAAVCKEDSKPSTGTVTQTAVDTSSSTAVNIAKALAEAGYSKASTAGVLGNVQQESNFDPTSQNTDGYSGLVQTQVANYRKWFDENGLNDVSWQDEAAQIRFIVGYAASRPAWTNGYLDAAKNQGLQPIDDDLYTTWLKTDDPEQAALAFMHGYERPNDDTAGKREQYARAWYDNGLEGITFTGTKKDSPSDAGSNDNGADMPATTVSSTSQCVTASSESRSGIIGKYTQWAVDTANNESIGYSQKNRHLDPDVDCSSFVYYALTKGGGFDGDAANAFDTSSAGAKLKEWGFEKHDKGVELQKGDILLEPASHMEVMVSDKEVAGAHHDENGDVCEKGECQSGDQGGEEVSVQQKAHSWDAYTEVWRLPASFSRSGDSGSASYGKVGGAPTDRDDYGWMCSSYSNVCKSGDVGKFYPHLTSGYQCVWYAWNRLADIHGTDGWTWVQGDGGSIAANVAGKHGWTVDKNPHPGDGISGAASSFSATSYGHVAVVEEVAADPSGWKIRISEGNARDASVYGSWNEYRGDRWFTKDQLAGSTVQFFRNSAWK